MKSCPHCGRHFDLTMSFCLDDGTPLRTFVGDVEADTAVISSRYDEPVTLALPLGDAAGQGPGNSIAVLPFVNMSSDADNEYFCDGLAEELLNALGKIPELKVAARTSAFSFKGENATVAEIGNALNVKTVLEGSVRKSGNRLRITAQLVNAADGYHLWSERYDREMKEIFEVQDDITLAVVRALKLKLIGGQQAEVLKRYTENIDAYQNYLQGRYHYASRTRSDVMRGLDHFERAIDADPSFALAYTWIADAYASMPAYPYMSPKEAFPKSQEAATRALELAPDLAEAHTASAYSLSVYEWNWDAAEAEFKRAMELDPDSYELHYRYGLLYLAVTGRKDEAVEQVKRALELEPLSLITGANLVAVYLYAGFFDLALEQAKITYGLDGDFVVGGYFLGLAYNANGMFAEALSLSETLLRSEPDNQLMLRVMGDAFARSGRKPEAEKVIDSFREIANTRYGISYFPASIFASMGEFDAAFSALEQSFAQNDWELHRLKVDPFLKPLHDDSRFNGMLERLHLSS